MSVYYNKVFLVLGSFISLRSRAHEVFEASIFIAHWIINALLSTERLKSNYTLI